MPKNHWLNRSVTEPEVQKPTESEVQEATVEVVSQTEPVAPEQTSLFESKGKPEAEAPKEPKTTQPEATEPRSEVGLLEDTGMKCLVRKRICMVHVYRSVRFEICRFCKSKT